MRLLLDTCVFLWICEGSPRLSRRARELYRDPANDAFLSSASAWEIAVKHGLGRLPLPSPPWSFVPRQRLAHGIGELPISEAAALTVSRLPDSHRDPFDRMLVAQALCDDLTILTPDELFHGYPARVEW